MGMLYKREPTNKSLLCVVLSWEEVEEYCGDQMFKHFLFVLLTLAALVHAQDQSGFISIDCGIANNSSYTDGITNIKYVSDAEYTDSGVSGFISTQFMTNETEQQFYHVRSFPQGAKSCYTLTPPKLKGLSNYFVRARFMYGNYDGENEIPAFDLYLGVNYWDTVELMNASTTVTKELLHVPSSNFTYVCLVHIGRGTPFISVLDLRLVDDDIYNPTYGSLALFGRYDVRSYDNEAIIRYGDDIFDRIWLPSFFELDRVSEISTSRTISASYKNIYKLPPVIMNTAVTPKNASNPLEFSWLPPDPTMGYYIYMHFADFQSNQTREFDITLNEHVWYSGLKPDYLYTTTVFSPGAETPAGWFNFSLVKTENSTLPPILNAIEIYIVKEFLTLQTDEEDSHALKDIKLAYGVKKNWQGDPCTPIAYLWEGINCLITDSSLEPPRITSLNLSSSGLTGNISPSIFNLKMLQYLDLSKNSLTGEIPDFLSQMEKLTVLNLTGNNLTGTVPAELIKRSKSGKLLLSVDGNPKLCMSNSCETTIIPEKKKKNNNIIVPLGVSVAAVSAILLALVIFCIFFLKRRDSKQKQVASTEKNIMRDTPLKSKQQQFTYSEVVKITRNFQRALGKGGFGTVYHGYLKDNTQVAVKMLSLSSAQGYKEFKAEAELLMRVHHRNLTTLVGYCDEGDKLGLIYEYMANGDLETHLSDKNQELLRWDLRLEIALDAAQGLEYLHTGCKPPIIHRDVKSTNILLTDEFQAKLGDFGLSKVFPTDGSTHVSTAFAGTPGYLDPEFNLNEKSDVFSFGVVLLEIITGQPAIARTQERTHISRWVSHMLKTEGDVRNVIEPRLGKDLDLNSVWKAVDVAMECVSAASIARPTMSHVVNELKRCLEMEKERTMKGDQSEPNYDSPEMSFLGIAITESGPVAR